MISTLTGVITPLSGTAIASFLSQPTPPTHNEENDIRYDHEDVPIASGTRKRKTRQAITEILTATPNLEKLKQKEEKKKKECARKCKKNIASKLCTNVQTKIEDDVEDSSAAEDNDEDGWALCRCARAFEAEEVNL
ncbi:hypothetical protein FQR65_LT00340 [Abscondita terminalis]|nr:hypothetical protein FQR65_LT00340 [Abscondita terminalis]